MAIGTKSRPSCASSHDDELVGELREAKEELFNLRFQAATGQLEQQPAGSGPSAKRHRAASTPLMRERELGIETP